MKSALIITFFLFFTCTPVDQQPPTAAGEGGLKKVLISSPGDLEALRTSGVDIIVLEESYAIIRFENSTAVSSFNLKPFAEAELIQRLVEITLTDSLGVQPIVDNGLDLWEAEGDKAIARAFDFHIEKLREMGYHVNVLAKNASLRGEQR